MQYDLKKNSRFFLVWRILVLINLISNFHIIYSVEKKNISESTYKNIIDNQNDRSQILLKSAQKAAQKNSIAQQLKSERTKEYGNENLTADLQKQMSELQLNLNKMENKFAAQKEKIQKYEEDKCEQYCKEILEGMEKETVKLRSFFTDTNRHLKSEITKSKKTIKKIEKEQEKYNVKKNNNEPQSKLSVQIADREKELINKIEEEENKQEKYDNLIKFNSNERTKIITIIQNIRKKLESTEYLD